MSSNAIFAEPMLDSDDFLEGYKEQLIELGSKGLLPPLDLKLKYKVYSIRGEKFGAHKSIVLTTNDEHFFTVELGFINWVDGKKHIYPVTQAIDKSLKANMEYLGEIEATGLKLIGKAAAVMKNFGKYFSFSTTAKTTVLNMYAEAIGLEDAQKLTDGDKLALKAVTGGLLASTLLFLFSVTRRVLPMIDTRGSIARLSTFYIYTLNFAVTLYFSYYY